MSIETLRPNAAGDECNITYEAGAACPNHYQNVDEETPDEDSTEVHEDNYGTYIRDLYNIADHAVGSGTINFIKVYARCRAYGEPDQVSLKIAIKSGTGSGDPDTVSEGSEETVTTSFANYSHQWDTNPATSAAWTWDEIDKLQAGIALRQAEHTAFGWATVCTQVYVEVDYTAITPKTSSDAGSGVEGTPMQAIAVADSELGQGSDSLIVKIETPTKGGGTKLWT